MSACTAGGHLKFETALFLGRAFGHGDLVTIRVAGEDERQRAVAGSTGDGGRYVTLNGDATIYRMEETGLAQVLTLAALGLS